MKDEEIIGLYFGREEAAVSETDKKYGPLCRKLAFDILGSNEDAEEAVNSAYMNLWEAMPPKKPESLCGYLCMTLRNVALNMYRRKKKAYATEQLTELMEILPYNETTESSYDKILLVKAINDFLGTLSESSRLIFVSRYYFNLSESEIAEKFHLSDSAVRTRLFRIRQQLKAYLLKEGIEV